MMRRGVVLIAVLVLTAMSGMIAASVLFRMRSEVLASTARLRGRQAYAAAMSGLGFAAALVEKGANDTDLWYDNPRLMRNRFVCDDGANRWYFTIYAYNPADPGSVRYGLSDQAGKINLNTADERILLALPNMTVDRVDCLLDYIDEDDRTRPCGAEQNYYDDLPIPYAVKNGPLETLDELLLIKGFGGAVVYGEDANFSGLLEPNEDDGDVSFPPDDGDGVLEAGIRALAAVRSGDVPEDGEDHRIDINGDDRELERLVRTNLDEQTVNFIILYRAEGNRFEAASDLLEMTYELTESHVEPIRVDAESRIDSGVTADDLPLILEELTASDGAPPAGGPINVNTAPVAVLAAIDGIDEATAQRIVSARARLSSEDKSSISYLLTEDIVDAETFRKIAPMLGTRAGGFAVQCVGFCTPAGVFCVLEAVIDVSGGRARITYLRDITRLGLPFAIETAELEVQG